MKNANKGTTLGVLSKEMCIKIVKKCRTEEEVEEKYKDVHAAITKNGWFVLYGKQYLGRGLSSKEKEIEFKPTKAETNNIPSFLETTYATGKESPSKEKTVAKIYKLKLYQPLSYTLNVGRNKKLIVWDKESETNRAIRHCPNERSIYLDQQNKDTAVIEPIVFIKGFYNTTERDEYTQLFLEASPKFNVVFELVNAEVNANKLITREDLIIDIKTAIRDKSKTEAGIQEIRAIVSVLNSDPAGAAKMTPSELRYAAYTSVDTNPNRFVDDNQNITIFDDKKLQRISIAQFAFLSGVIQASADGRHVMWSDNKATICNIPPGLGYMEVFSEFLGTEEGVPVARELTKR